MDDFQLRCKHESHNNQKIIGVCVNSNCNDPRLCCYDCLVMKNRNHNQHSEQIIQLANFKEWKLIGGQMIEQIQQLIYYTDNLSQSLKQIVSENQKAISINLEYATSSQIEESISVINKVKTIESVLKSDIDQLSRSIQKMLKELQCNQGIAQQFNHLSFQQKNIIKEKQIIKPLAIQNIKFLFSKQFKDRSIEVLDQGRVAKSGIFTSGFCLCEPMFPKNIETAFAIKYLGGKVSIGICERDIINKVDQYSILTNNNKGSYFIDNNGYTYPPHFMDEKQSNFQFSPNDIIIVRVDFNKYIITWINQKTNKKFTIRLGQQEQEFFPCVYLLQGTVELLDSF